jgi:hypothetical protein
MTIPDPSQRGNPRWAINARPGKRNRRPIDFAHINAAALSRLPELLARWLPDGRRQGHEYVALNPLRSDERLGSFSINLRSGRWADFACDARGGDPISLAAYLGGLSQGEAAQRLADMLGVDHD